MQKRRYPGVSPFTSDQQNIFFGRDDDIKKLQKLITLRNQILLYSKSGIGKTSLLNAGVLPKFENKYTIIKVRFFAYNNEKSETPLEKTINRIKSKTKLEKTSTILSEIAEQTNYKKSLWYYFKQLQLINKKEQKYIIAFDQFEELFSYPKEQINEFKNQLYELTKIDIPDSIMQFIANTDNDNEEIDLLYEDIKIKTIFAIRSDRLSLLNQLTDKLPDIQETFYELKPLNNQQAEQAIINPAKDKNNFETHPFVFETKAIENIINALSDNQKQKIETTQLQIVCQKIEDIAQEKANNTLKTDTVKITNTDLPKFKDIFLNFYDNAIKQTKQQTETQKFIEDQLIRNEQRISLDEIICQDFVTKQSLKILTNTHLLRAERNSTGGFSYELSHDTLIEPILVSRKERIEKEKVVKYKKEIEFINYQNKIKMKKRTKSIITYSMLILVVGLIITYFITDSNRIKKEKENQAEMHLNLIDSLNTQLTFSNDSIINLKNEISELLNDKKEKDSTINELEKKLLQLSLENERLIGQMNSSLNILVNLKGYYKKYKLDTIKVSIDQKMNNTKIEIENGQLTMTYTDPKIKAEQLNIEAERLINNLPNGEEKNDKLLEISDLLIEAFKNDSSNETIKANLEACRKLINEQVENIEFTKKNDLNPTNDYDIQIKKLSEKLNSLTNLY